MMDKNVKCFSELPKFKMLQEMLTTPQIFHSRKQKKLHKLISSLTSFQAKARLKTSATLYFSPILTIYQSFILLSRTKRKIFYRMFSKSVFWTEPATWTVNIFFWDEKDFLVIVEIKKRK